MSYVKDKIKGDKKGELLARARKGERKEHWPASLAKVIKKAISISELMTHEDQSESVRVLREAKAATHRIFDPAVKQLIEVPDHKTRLAAVTLELAYTEGRPVERQIVARADVTDFAERLRRLQSSERFKQLQNSEHSIAKGVIDVEVSSASNPAVGDSGE